MYLLFGVKVKKVQQTEQTKVFVPCLLLRNLRIKNTSARVRLLLNLHCTFQQHILDSVFPTLFTCCVPNPAQDWLQASGQAGGDCRAACAPLIEGQLLSWHRLISSDLVFRLLFMSFAI